MQISHCLSFKSHAHSILLATDIAARGLDIPSVSHVVHYQFPRTVDTYIHRNGRTARAQRHGFSLLICAPDERRVARALFGSLGRRACCLALPWFELTRI